MPIKLPTPTIALPIISAPEGGGVVGAVTDYDTSVGIVMGTQAICVAPRADISSALNNGWFLNNVGPNTLYYGPSGVTSGTGTAVAAGSKSALIPLTNTYSTFVVCAASQTAGFIVTNH